MAPIVDNDLSCILCEAYQGIFEVLYKYELLVVHSLVIIIENGGGSIWHTYTKDIWQIMPGGQYSKGAENSVKKAPFTWWPSDTLSLSTLKAKRLQFTRPRRGYNFRHSTPFPLRKQNVTFKRAGLQSGLQIKSNTDLKWFDLIWFDLKWIQIFQIKYWFEVIWIDLI